MKANLNEFSSYSDLMVSELILNKFPCVYLPFFPIGQRSRCVQHGNFSREDTYQRDGQMQVKQLKSVNSGKVTSKERSHEISSSC